MFLRLYSATSYSISRKFKFSVIKGIRSLEKILILLNKFAQFKQANDLFEFEEFSFK